MNATHLDKTNGHLLKFENRIDGSTNALYVDLTSPAMTTLPNTMVEMIVPAYMKID